jgi:cell division protein FtsW (lipid II flippase)
MIPAIIDGAADRLRPVLLTTLTTVLGLAPLLYEQSQQAQFLKPTVITLCYGLGFGMLLVLFLVPALLAAQRDVGQAVAAVRRALARSGPARTATGVAVAAAALALAAGFGPLFMGGDGVLARLPVPPAVAAFLVFATVLAAALCLVYLAAALLSRRQG